MNEETRTRLVRHLAAPPDNCPTCLRSRIAPMSATTASNGEITGHYLCPACLREWDQTWRLETR